MEKLLKIIKTLFPDLQCVKRGHNYEIFSIKGSIFGLNYLSQLINSYPNVGWYISTTYESTETLPCIVLYLSDNL